MNINQCVSHHQAIKAFRDDLKCRVGCTCFDCTLNHVANGCNYGLPSGPDDYTTECDCGE
jgi:hypothetical protein